MSLGSVGTAAPDAIQARLTRPQYAKRIGVNPATVWKWTQTGRITLGPDGLIDPEEADRQRAATESPLARHQTRKRQFEERRARMAAELAAAQAQGAPEDDAMPEDQPERAEPTAAAPRAPGGFSTHEELGLALKLETYRLQKAKAEQANLELDRAAGLLVERSEVEYLLQDLAATLHSKLDGLAVQLAPALAAHRGDVSAMQGELEGRIRDLLAELAQHVERKVQQHLGETR
jgi:hypothetical protein